MDQLFRHIINMSITGSYVIVFIMIARLFLRRVPKIFSYALWSVVLFRLLCPFSMETIFSLIPSSVQGTSLNKIHTQAAPVLNQTMDTNPAININLLTTSPTAAMGTISPTPPDPWLIIAQYIWLTGIIILVFYSIITTIRLHRNLRNAIPIFDNVYERSGIITPFVYGFLKPKIYLPIGLSDKEQAYILKHEQVHIRRFDHIIKPLAFAVLCLHWFNPLVWIAFFLMSDDMEKSCDESVIRQMGSGIKKDYSTSLLTLSTGKRFIGGSPLAFGESHTKGRIKNILNYKKPTFWVLIITILAVAALSLGLLSNPQKKSLTKSLTVEDYAKQFMEQNIKSYENYGIQIMDSEITKLEKIASFDHLLESPVEIWSLEYRLKPDDASKLAVIDNVKDGLITEEASMGKPMLIFSYPNSVPHYLGEIRSGEMDESTLAGQETALRVFLESIGQLPQEAYRGNHILVKFPLTSGETSQLLLSQPVIQGDSGIWMVERWKDTNGNEYYNTPATDRALEDYYADLQNQADEGKNPSLLDPLQVALNYISNDIGMGQHIKLEQLDVNYKATVEDFAITPESTLIGYVKNLNMENHSFDFDNVEWLTMKDSARFEGLNINPDDDMPNGFYILNKYTYTNPYEVTDNTKYHIVNWEDMSAPKEVSKQEFIEYFKRYTDFVPPCIITTRDGIVTSISEKYVP